VASTLGESIGDTVGVPSAECEPNILGDAVVLSVDEAEGLISAVFVSVCKGDGDTVEGRV
jgi:hypothetical protein